MVAEADNVIMAVPIYNWAVGSSAKNFVELTGATAANGHRAAWFDKVVTFLCAGGLPHSYMAYSHQEKSPLPLEIEGSGLFVTPAGFEPALPP